MTSIPDFTVAIIGAGMGGLSCAQRLVEQGITCTVFDRGRRVGGRVNTREIELDGHAIRFDHGAPMLHARTVAFNRVFDDWIGAGLVEEARGTDTGRHPGVRGVRALGGMQLLAEHLARGLAMNRSCTVERATQDGNGWTVQYRRYGSDTTGSIRSCALVFACPVPQAARVLAASGVAVQEILRGVEYAPTRTCMILLEQTLPTGGQVMRLGGDRSGAIESIDVQAIDRTRTLVVTRMSPRWGIAHVESDAAEAESDMVAHALRVLGERFDRLVDAGRVRLIHSHRWGLAFASATIDRTHALDRERWLGFAGDVFGGSEGVWIDAEASYLSGLALADELGRYLG